MDEFNQADLSDYLLDRADEEEIRRQDWHELHGDDRPTLAEYLEAQRFCPHHDEPLDGYGKCRECYWLDQAYREDRHG